MRMNRLPARRSPFGRPLFSRSRSGAVLAAPAPAPAASAAPTPRAEKVFVDGAPLYDRDDPAQNWRTDFELGYVRPAVRK
jgi:hypothetical protein